jgi:hypothetical protein
MSQAVPLQKNEAWYVFITLMFDNLMMCRRLSTGFKVHAHDRNFVAVSIPPSFSHQLSLSFPILPSMFSVP